MNKLILKLKKITDHRENIGELNMLEYKKLIKLGKEFKIEKIEIENTGVGDKVIVHYKEDDVLKLKDISDYSSW